MKSVNLTICSVVYSKNHQLLLDLNYNFTKKINKNIKINWIAVDNSEKSERVNLDKSKYNVIKGVKRNPIIKASGSYNHAEGLNQALKHVKTKFLLVLDCDLYIVKKNWIIEVTNYLSQNKLSFFGTPWHPKWFDKYRYFPCVHCLFINLKYIKINDLNFLPEINESSEFLKKIIYYFTGLKKRYHIQNSKDTGIKIFNKFYKSKIFKTESTKPVYILPTDFVGPKNALGDLNIFIEKILPENLCYLPKKNDSYTTNNFKSYKYPNLHQFGFEEYIWDNKPFAFHYRGKKRDSNNFTKDFQIIKKSLLRISNYS